MNMKTGGEPKQRRLASIGECMVELSEAPEAGPGMMRLAFAGDTLNTAVYLARSLRWQKEGEAWTVAYATRLGDDEMSSRMIEGWRQEGIEVDLVEREARSLPGLYMIQTDAAGERRFSYWRENAPARRLFTEPAQIDVHAALSACDAIYFTGISLAILGETGRRRLLELGATIRQKGGMVAFDGNYRPALWSSASEAAHWLRLAYQTASVALPSVEETRLFGCGDADALLDRLRGFGPAEIVVKQGAGPCVAACGDERMQIQALPVARIVDATAAGDSFNAAYLAARLTGAPAAAAIRLGHHLAGQVIRSRGAILPAAATSIPGWRDLTEAKS
jgi:2-dehydro-3-deoxygluconokinase